ncbi:MAG: glycogen synthase, partial [Elusimicrobia bacterium CG_4_10_14_0_8_um_filter_37_32]
EPKQISSAVNRLLKDKGLSERMGENGRARVEEKFSWTKIAQQTKELYESLI